MKVLVSTKQFSLRFSPKAVTPPIALRYLSSPVNPIRPKIEHLCDNRDPNTLWWRVSVKDIQDHKRVVRSWCARRTRHAFIRELKGRGFDEEGRRLPNSIKSPPEDGIGGNLRGSVNIWIKPTCIEEKYSAVQAEVKTLMDALFRELQIHHQKQLWQSRKNESKSREKPKDGESENVD
ncbi:hypothetical protein P175DRAFT_0503717 [Aspergillus ochraceoroseus IBT 24754]|uniref:Uncharacterized protein n=3 Tax=Aspergillus subgen. Nidulantes TaxID=2720870 RepID=A0A0F8XFQ6_9EURO|nr:uncharacterized protein P175DRAFT_0503717 [Aspergillus ochraceoroseus IBT 24754]KKK18685.1 hypothetical protein AOCH_005285 [Aspergillus ochraceoroseus]KKK22427.1 hypothetical protein ARAM_006663 [Aspergillus rambellii]PTU18898.1 hypothetical protein P175DRAFT_0503717 [Aspergillus ochraceoroseus IBT 24754]